MSRHACTRRDTPGHCDGRRIHRAARAARAFRRHTGTSPSTYRRRLY